MFIFLVVGLDDIMDEGAKESSHSTTDEDDLSSNRKLRDQMDGTTLKSPRKSPRLMTQGNCSEEIRIFSREF